MELHAALHHTDPKRLLRLGRVAAAICEKNHIPLTIQSADNSTDYYRIATRREVNMLIMQGDEGGLRLGRQIRQENQAAVLIYVDCAMERVLEAFERLPIAYLPVGAQLYDYARAMRNGWRWLGMQRRRPLSYQTKGCSVQIQSEEIEFLESRYRQVVIHLRNGKTDCFSAKLDDVEKKLDACLFFRCHQSYLINLAQVQRIVRARREIWFASGACAFVSKAHYAALMERMEMEGADIAIL